MNESVLLVDFENIGSIDLEAIPAAVYMPFFIGTSQRTVAVEFLKGALKLGERFEPIDVEGHGKNALDFHIAFYLGEYLARSPAARCVVLSKDKGFDPLIKHLVRRGFSVRRASSLAEAFAPKVSAATAEKEESGDHREAAFRWLASMQKNKRPRKLKGLIAYLHSRFSRKLTEAEIRALVEQMLANRKLSDTGGAITYHF